MKEKQESLQKLVEKFFEDAKPFFGEGQNRGLIAIAIDETVGDNQVAMTGTILGKKSKIVMGVDKMMDKSEEFRDVINEAVNFRRFKKDPVKGLLDMIHQTLGEIEEDMAKRKADEGNAKTEEKED